MYGVSYAQKASRDGEIATVTSPTNIRCRYSAHNVLKIHNILKLFVFSPIRLPR